MQFDKGYLSPYFVTDAERMEASFDNALILINEKKISNVQDLVPVREKVARAGQPLVIIAEDIGRRKIRPKHQPRPRRSTFWRATNLL